MTLCPYRVLGVEKGATATEIKAAYRKLSVQWHPDKFNKEPEKAELAKVRFQEVGAAWARLGDPEQRQKHDSGVDGFDWFAEFLNSFVRPPAHAAWREPPPARGMHLKRPLSVPFLVSLRGGSVELEHGDQVLVVSVPAGVESGTKLCLAGKGEPGHPPGNLYLEVTVEPHEQLRRDGLTVAGELLMTWAEVAAGGPLRVPTPWGPFLLRYAPLEVGEGHEFELPGYGVRLPSDRGSLLYTVRLVAPAATAASAELAAVLQELQVDQAPRRKLEASL